MGAAESSPYAAQLPQCGCPADAGEVPAVEARLEAELRRAAAAPPGAAASPTLGTVDPHADRLAVLAAKRQAMQRTTLGTPQTASPLSRPPDGSSIRPPLRANSNARAASSPARGATKAPAPPPPPTPAAAAAAAEAARSPKPDDLLPNMRRQGWVSSPPLLAPVERGDELAVTMAEIFTDSSDDEPNLGGGGGGGGGGGRPEAEAARAVEAAHVMIRRGQPVVVAAACGFGGSLQPGAGEDRVAEWMDASLPRGGGRTAAPPGAVSPASLAEPAASWQRPSLGTPRASCQQQQPALPPPSQDLSPVPRAPNAALARWQSVLRAGDWAIATSPAPAAGSAKLAARPGRISRIERGGGGMVWLAWPEDGEESAGLPLAGLRQVEPAALAGLRRRWLGLGPAASDRHCAEREAWWAGLTQSD
eukprot:SAG22_NODE_1490_length_4307_cov_6.140684_1_plen_419_part_10